MVAGSAGEIASFAPAMLGEIQEIAAIRVKRIG
jgi:hypothetical protein